MLSSPANASRKIVILGNGPSLRKEDFAELKDVATLGMNAAYRYWHSINWYPNYYCCLDDQVVVSHADEIKKMIIEKRCERFFLHQNFFDVHPELAGHPLVLGLCQLWPGENNRQRCEKYRLEHIPSDIFHSTAPGKFTTGAYSVRFAHYMGYEEVGLIGTDCRYVEVLPEAKNVDGNVLEITTTPTTNKNYFFEDYQKEGDRYNIPNPAVHEGNLHLQAFETLAKDVSHYRLNLKIFICTVNSELYDQRTFPYLSLKQFVYGRYLSAVMIPFIERDIEPLLNRMNTWGVSDFAPYSEASFPPHVDLCFCFNGTKNSEIEKRFIDAFQKNALHKFFRRLEFNYSNLTGLDDQYTRNFSGNHGAAGYMSGPNNQFFDIINKFSRNMAHIMLMEADVAPIRANWLAKIEELTSGPEEFWICGSHYRGLGDVKAFWHVNGNALYNVGSEKFRDFFDNTFLPYFRERVVRAPSLAYDIVLYDLFAKLFGGAGGPKDAFLWGEIAHRVRFSDFIVDISHSEDRKSDNLLDVTTARERYSDCYLLHGAVSKVDAEIDRLVQLKSTKVSIVSIDCDAVDYFGHFLAYDRHVIKAATLQNVEIHTLTNKELDPAILKDAGLNLLPTFSENSWNRKPEHIAVFQRELRTAISKIQKNSSADEFILYMYCAGLEHAEVIAELCESQENLRCNVNLFWAYNLNEKNHAIANRWKPFLKYCENNSKICITAPTVRLQRDFQEAFEVRLPVAPHPSTTFSDEEARSMARMPVRRLSTPPQVLFPSGMRAEKGYELTVESALELSKDPTIECTVRGLSRSDTPTTIAQALEKLRASRPRVIEKELNAEEFQEFITSGDVVVCPYLPSAFARRTSGLIIDAIIGGSPIVAVEGTWLADFIRTTGAGIAAKPTTESVVDAVHQILKDYDSYAQKAATARRQYLKQHSWEALIRSILVSPPAPSDFIASSGRYASPELLSGSAKNSANRSTAEGGSEVDETEVLAHMLEAKKGGNFVMLDVGAHVGTSAIHFANRDWKVICFEPDSVNRQHLSSLFQGYKNVTIDPRALSDQKIESASFFRSDVSTGISSLMAFHESHVLAGDVTVTTVAEIVAEYELPHVTFLKIDAEGLDLAILKGVPWENLHPDVIECEFEDAKTLKLGHNAKEIADFLVQRGYSIYVSEWHPVVQYGVPHNWRRIVPYEGCDLGADSWGNFLAFREDPGYDAVKSAFAALVKTRAQENSAAGTAANSPANAANVSMSGLEKAARSTQSKKTTDDQNGIVNMLQKTPPQALGAQPPPGKMWYSGPAHKLQQISPSAFGALRFARRTFAHVMARPHMIALLLGSSALTAWIGLDDRFEDSRDAIFMTAGLGILGAALVYVAAKAQAHLASLHLQNAAARAELASVQARLSQVDQQIALRDNAATAALTRQVAELKADLALAKASNSQSAAELKAKYAELSNKSAALLADASKIRADLAPLAQKMTELERADQALLAKSREADQALSSRLDALKNERSSIEGQVASVSQKVGAMDARITASEKWSRFENAAWFQHFNRKLSKQHVDTLDKEWRKRLSVPMQPATLGYMANRACEIERQLEGRLATSIEDILLRSLVARAVRGKNVDVLEIGTLFGTGAAIMFDALEGHYEQIHFTLLDPLEGYYNGAQADILTGQRVNESVVRKNFARVGMREDQYTLIKHLSTEPEAKEKASARKYDVLVIDGDHSYAGVKTDFENFAPLVRVGGYIILDDYNSPDWPDVKEYVDKELGKHDFVAPVGATWRTSVYRVVKDAPRLDHSASASARTKLSSNPDTEDTQSADD